MSSELDLINLALAKLGEEDQLADLGQDPPVRAQRVAQSLLPTLRDAILRKHPWLCALRRRELTLITMPGRADFRFTSAFQLPPDYLRIWAVGTSRPWTRGLAEERDASGDIVARRQAILCSGDGPLRAVLVERVPYEDFDAGLFVALATELASAMAGPLQADKALAKSLKQEAQDALAEAITAETSELGNEAIVFESAWLAARYGGGLDGWSYDFEGGGSSAAQIL